MSKGQSITNKARGPRIVHRRLDKDRMEPVILAPGEVLDDFVPANPDDPVFRGMVDSGDLQLGDQEAEPANQEERFRNSPSEAHNRQAATMAGNMEGLADPLPEQDRGANLRDAQAARGIQSQEEQAASEEGSSRKGGHQKKGGK